MPETYEKDGIVYFKEPYGVDYLDWISAHEYCDGIALFESDFHENVGSGETIYMLCFASDKSLNSKIEELFDTDYADNKFCIVRGDVPRAKGCISMIKIPEEG